MPEWQVKQRACGVVVVSLTRVTSLVTRISWQAGTAHRNRGVNELAFSFVLMALGALGGIGVLFQRYRMDSGKEEICAGDEA